MTIPPESIEVGKCYLVTGSKALWIRRVIEVLPDGRVQYEQRTAKRTWKMGVQYKDVFASMLQREVPCDWVPEGEE